MNLTSQAMKPRSISFFLNLNIKKECGKQRMIKLQKKRNLQSLSPIMF